MWLSNDLMTNVILVVMIRNYIHNKRDKRDIKSSCFMFYYSLLLYNVLTAVLATFNYM